MIDFDALVTGPCVSVLGGPVAIQVDSGTPLISTLGDGITPLQGIFERAMREVRDDPNTGATTVIARPTLGMSFADLTSAGITVLQLNNGVVTVTTDGQTWKIANAEGPDSGGNVKIYLTVTSLLQ